MRHGRTEHIKAELRQLTPSVSAVLGLVLAMPWALTYDAPRTACEADSGVCWDRLYDQLVPMLGRMALGIGLGLALGLALCHWMPGLKRSRRKPATRGSSVHD